MAEGFGVISIIYHIWEWFLLGGLPAEKEASLGETSDSGPRMLL